MRASHILPVITVVAALSFGGCSGCDRASDTRSPVTPSTVAQPAPVAPSPSTSTTSTVPVVSDRNGRYALFRPLKATVGDVVTMEADTTTTGKFTRIGAGGPPIPAVLDVLHAEWVETISEVDGAGSPTRYTVSIRTWTRHRDRQRDRTLMGAVLAVSGTGTARQWTFVQKPSTEPTQEARSWLDEHFGARGYSDQDWLRVLLPDETVAIGETWTPSPERLATVMTAAGMAVERSRIGTSATFDGIEQGLGRVSFKGDFALSKVPNTDVAWTSGGRLAFEGDMSITLEPASLGLRTLHRTGTLSGDATMDGATMSYDFRIDEKRTATPGAPAETPRR